MSRKPLLTSGEIAAMAAVLAMAFVAVAAAVMLWTLAALM